MLTSSNTWESIPIIRAYLPCRDKDVYGWKKVFANVQGNTTGNQRRFPVVAKLRIPKDAGIVCGPLKCRAGRAIVDGFYAWDHICTPSPDNELSLRVAHSAINPNFLYIKGSEILPDYLDTDPTVIYSHGIHFFRTYKEAAAYDFM